MGPSGLAYFSNLDRSATTGFEPLCRIVSVVVEWSPLLLVYASEWLLSSTPTPAMSPPVDGSGPVAIGFATPIKFKVELNESATNTFLPATANCSGPKKEADSVLMTFSCWG